MQKNQLLIVTGVWGDWHLSKYLEIALPTLLASGNLPALGEEWDVTYRICATQRDIERLRHSPVVQVLEQRINVQYENWNQQVLESPMTAHLQIWDEAIGSARKSGAFIMLLPPDTAWSDGSLRYVGRQLASGKKAVYMTYLRAEEKLFSEGIMQWAGAGARVISISGARLVEMTMNALHPMMKAYFRSSERFPSFPELILWPVEGQGVLCRMLAREMFAFDPTALKINTQNQLETRIDPVLIHVVDDSDDLFAVSLALADKDSAWYREAGKAYPQDTTEWWLEYDSWVNDLLAGTKTRWHHCAVTDAAWRAREHGADVFLRRAAVWREGIRLWRAVRRLRCGIAARLIAVAVETGLMARAARGRGGVLAFVPIDAAFSSIPSGSVERLLGRAGERELVRLIRMHYVPTMSPVGAEPLEDRLGRENIARLTTAEGGSLRIERAGESFTVNGISVVGEPARSGNNLLYRVDGLILPKA